MQKEINTFNRLSINNRWKKRRIQRSDNWVIIGIQLWWCSPYDYCYKICLLGIDFQFWFKRSFKD